MTSKPSICRRHMLGALVWLMIAAPIFSIASEPTPSVDEENSARIFAEVESLRQQVARLNTHMPSETGLNRRIAHRRLERVWSRIASETHKLARDAETMDGADAQVQAQVTKMLPTIDLALREALTRIQSELNDMNVQEVETTPATLAAAYHQRERLAQHLTDLLRAQQDNVALMQTHLDDDERVTQAQQWINRALVTAAFEFSLALEIATDDAAALAAQLRDLKDDQDLQARYSIVRGRLESLAAGLRTVIEMLAEEDVDVAEYRQQIVVATGQISDDLFDGKLIGRLATETVAGGRDWVMENGPRIVVRTLSFLLIIAAFWLLAGIVGKLVERALRSSRLNTSNLLRDISRRFVHHIILLFGVLIALSQIGISVGPVLAGLGVAGFVLGFALQDSLSNFASGVMILIYRPFDVSDIVEVGDVFGRVEGMSLVNTTVLTFDNQTLIVPNSKVWGDVIKNVTAQHERRVDMMFGISYEDDIQRAEEILCDILASHDKVLDEPEPVVRLHELADSSVNFVVRPWVARDDYWPVYWDVTRAVKLRFDEAGVTIPFPQRELHFDALPTQGVDIDSQEDKMTPTNKEASA